MDTLVGSTLRQGVRARKSAGSYRREDELGCTEMPEKKREQLWYMIHASRLSEFALRLQLAY